MDPDSTSAGADNTAQKQRGRPFEPGKSGNPAGRPKGRRNRATVAMEALLDGEAEEIVSGVIEEAKEGNMIALRLCLERILPPRRDRPVTFDMPALATAADAMNASAALVQAVARGELTPSEAAEISGMVHAHVKLLELTEIERRLVALEQARQQP